MLPLALLACTEYNYGEVPEDTGEPASTVFDEPLEDFGLSGNALMRMCPTLAVDMCALDLNNGGQPDSTCANNATLWEEARETYIEDAFTEDLQLTDLVDGKVTLTGALRYYESPDEQTDEINTGAELYIALGDRSKDMIEVVEEAEHNWAALLPYNLITCEAYIQPNGLADTSYGAVWDEEQYGSDTFFFYETLHGRAGLDGGEFSYREIYVDTQLVCDPDDDGEDLILVPAMDVMGTYYYDPTGDAACIAEWTMKYPDRMRAVEDLSLQPIFTIGRNALDDLTWFAKDNYPGDPRSDRDWVVFTTELELN